MSPPLDTQNLPNPGDPVQAPGQTQTIASGNYQPSTPGSDWIDQQSNMIRGADLDAQAEGSKSIGDRVTDIVTKGIPATGAAVFNSFYNTAVEVGNFYGVDAQKASIEDEFGPSSDVTSYYQNHAGPIEGVALAAGSLIPGLGATKVLKLAQAGHMGEAMQISTGLFSGMRDSAIASASEDMVGNVTGQSLFGLTSVNKMKAIFAGAADQALQGAVYETATLATMHASPITDDNTMRDNISDVLDAAKGFGMFGGVLEGASALYKINQGIRVADLATKAQEAFGSVGIGNIVAGDRALQLYTTADQIPPASNALGQMKTNITSNTTNRLIQSALIDATKTTPQTAGDEELAGAFKNFLDTGRAAGTIGSDELQNNLSGLSKLGRYDDTQVTSTPSNVFYIPKSIDPELATVATHDEIMSREATGESALSRAYSLTNPNQLPTIGRAADTFLLPDTAPGARIATPDRYNGALDAYRQGVDIFVDGKGGIHINPGSKVFSEVARPGENRILSSSERLSLLQTGNLPADSKPLNSVGMTLDVSNGKIFHDPAPPAVVGDIGKPTLYPQGLRVGDQLFPQKAGTEFAPGNTLDANARYVWASLRGIKNGDSIHPTDLPMLEQAYREKALGVQHNDLRFTDGSLVPQDAPTLISHIADIKQAKYSDLLEEGKNADQISSLLNAPTTGLTKNFNTTNPAELIIPPEQSANIRHIRLAYDIGTTKDSEGNLLRGLQATNYRMKIAADTNSQTVGNYLANTVGVGDTTGRLASDNFSALQFTKGAGDADILGAGAGFLSNANADYQTLAQQAQRMGKTVSDLITLRHSVVSDTLISSANALRTDLPASAEYGAWDAVVKSTGENYHLLTDAEADQVNLPHNTAVLEGAISTDSKSKQLSFNQTYLPPGFQSGSAQGGLQGLKSYYTLSPKVADLERASMSLNEARNSLRQDWWKSQGIAKEDYPPGRVYHPPIDGNKYPFMAYVREREGYALGQSGASILTAKSAQDLQQKISLLGPQYDAFTKADIANFKKAQGEYEFNRNFMTNRANTELARKGILNNVVPESRPQNIINDLADWHYRQEDQLLRDHVELHNAATFSQLTAMGDRFDQTGVSRFGAITPFMQRSATNPFTSYIRTALGLTSKDNYPLWQLAQEKLQAFGDTAFNAVKDAFGASQKGIIPVQAASDIAKKFGLGEPYGTALDQMSRSYYGGLANQLPSPDILSKFIATSNATLGATVIRLDTFQQLIHAVTLPIMTALEYGSASQDLQKLLTVNVPGTQTAAPGFARTLYNGVRNYFNDTDGSLAELYSKTGMTRNELQIHREMINQLSMPRGILSDSGWAQKIDKASQAAEKLTGTKFTNNFIHFIASDVGRQLGEAQGQTGQDLLDTIGTFSGRVLGNISAGQRAGIFQGPVGNAIGLFQSYRWNMMQQLFRHIGDGDVKALAMGAGMQSSIFGLSSLPGFQALNSMIADRHGNTSGSDLYSGATSMLGPDAADYLLYGSLSGLTGISLYSRGDLNPRSAAILPVNPMQLPSVQAGIRVYQMLSTLENNITTKGGSVPASLLLAAEHNGLSRPLTGLAEMVQGFSTNGNGAMVSPVAGLGDMTGIATMSRLLGARPLDESVALDTMYRNSALKVLDTSRLQELGAAAKTAMYNGSPVAPEVAQQFMNDYVKSGGTQDHFNQWFLQQNKDANIPAVNRVFENFHSPRSQVQQLMMGGQPLPDFKNTGDITPAPVDVQPPESQ